ncbi:hypothetical protein HanIR_Chr11g0549261 [Helianthus annuus]|nr:hypothetical protein HanIR_Chr11g0549261 [Helianthus annuus]KAJ0518936.1 hypothetical protein HanHA89_Chr11g0443001 [Helianthus annuus]
MSITELILTKQYRHRYHIHPLGHIFVCCCTEYQIKSNRHCNNINRYRLKACYTNYNNHISLFLKILKYSKNPANAPPLCSNSPAAVSPATGDFCTVRIRTLALILSLFIIRRLLLYLLLQYLLC